MKIFFSFLIVLLVGTACRAEVTTEKPREEAAKVDLKTAETIGFGFYAGGYPFGWYYGYPYYGYPYKRFFGIGYPYYGIRGYPAAPALPVWG